MSRARVTDMIIPGSIRTETTTWTRTLITVRCGRCGHEQEASATRHTATCRACGRAMRLDRAADGANVVPIRRRA